MVMAREKGKKRKTMLLTIDIKEILTGLFGKIEFVRKEKPSAGTKCWLMGLAADIAEVSETLSKEVLERVKQEAVLDADVDIDYDIMADTMLAYELEMTGDDLQELTQ